MSEAAWDSLISANKKSELKYRNVSPTLKISLGCPVPKKSRDLIPAPKKAPTLYNIIEDTYDGHKFLSIPDVTFLHHNDCIIASEFASVNHPRGRVSVFNERGQVINIFPKEDKGKEIFLFGISALPSDELAICTGDGVSVWDVEGRMTSRFTHNAVENCCHVTAMKNGLLATTCITEAEQKCISLWDPKSGEVVSQFGSRPEVIEINPLKQKRKILIRSSDIRLPWFVASDSGSNVYISDRTAQCIKVFDSRTNRFLRRFDTAGVDTRCQKGSFMPQGLDVDEDDNIFVADQIHNGVLVFDRHGEFVRTFPLDLDHNQCELWSLALNHRRGRPATSTRRNGFISPTRKLAVSFSNRKPRAHIYSLSFCRHYSIGF